MDRLPRRALRRLRVLTLNVWHRTEPWERRRELIRRGIARWHPDVIALQEVVAVPGAPGQAEELAGDGAYHVAWFPGGPYGEARLGNAVLSRYPIRERDAVSLPGRDGPLGRIAVRCDLDLPEGTLSVFCTHLSYRADDAATREAQVVALDREVRHGSRDLPRIVAGDLNADPESTAVRFLTGHTSIAGASTYYQDAGRLGGCVAPTWSTRNPNTETFHEGDRRIDYVLVSHARPDGCGVVTSARLLFDEPDPDGIWASDHFGVLAEIQLTAKTG